MTTEPQHPHIRQLTVCPRCTTPRSQGLVMCWPCHRALTKQHDGRYGAYYEQYLDCLEHVLAHEEPEDARPDEVPSFSDCVIALTS